MLDHNCNSPDPSDDDRIVDLLAEYDDALARGAAPTGDSRAADFGPAALAQIERLEVKMRALRAAPKTSATISDDSTRGGILRTAPAASDHSDDEELPEKLGRFEIVRRLGAGGSGVVFLARDPVLGRFVALKVPRLESMFTRDLRRRFLREAQAAARLAHPNLAQVYEVGEAGSICYIASVYCEGPNLAEWQRAQVAPVSPTTAAAWVAQLADAINYAHGEGVLHRDLKPSNVLLTSRAAVNGQRATNGYVGEAVAEHTSHNLFTPQVADFGLALIQAETDNETRSGLVIGTPAYMSPEQAQGRRSEVGPATDIYGLGAILFELLTGHAPFRGASDADILRQVVADEPRSPRRDAPEVPRDLDAICLKCLDKSISRRYTTAGELAADLRRYLAGEPTVARPIRPLGRLARWSRRKPLAGALAAVTLAAAATILLGSVWYSIQLTAAARLADDERRAAVASRHEAETQQARAESVAAHNARYMYAAQMRSAYQQRSVGQLERAQRLLDEYQPGTPYADLRGFEWYHLKRQLHGERATLLGHRGEVNSVLFTPDGRQLISGGEDGTIRCWDVASGAEMSSFTAHANCVNILALSPTGQVLASGSCDRTVRLWDVNTHQLLATLEGHTDQIEYLAFSPVDSNCLATCGAYDPIVKIWDLTEQRVVRSRNTKRVMLHTLAWQADGKVLFIGANEFDPTSKSPAGPGSTLIAWDLAADAEIDGVPNHDFGPGVMALDLSHTGKRLGVSIGEAIYELPPAEQDARLVPLKGHVHLVRALAYSRDDEVLASGGDDATIRVWDTRRNLCEQVLTGHAGRVTSLAFSPRDSTLASASFDGAIKLWGPLKPERGIRRVRPGGLLESGLFLSNDVAVSSDCRWLALCDAPGQLIVLDTADNNRETCRIPIPAKMLTAFRFSEESTQMVLNIAQESGQLLKWNVQKNQAERGALDLTAVSPVLTPEFGHRRIELAANGRRLISLDSQALKVFETQTGELLQTFPSHEPHWGPGVCFSPDGKTAGIAIQMDGHLLDLDSGKTRTCPGPNCISNGGNRVGQSDRHSLRLFDPASRDEPLLLEHSTEVQAYEFSPDSRTLATWTDGRDIRLWNVATGEAIAQFAAPLGAIRKLRFSADGRKLCAVTVVSEKPDETGAQEDRFYVVVWQGDEGL